MVSMAVTTSVLTTSAIAANYEVSVDPTQLKAVSPATSSKKGATSYIVQLKGASGITKARELGELMPSNQLVSVAKNNYNPNSTNIAAYTETLKNRQQALATEVGSLEILHKYTHTFNGFSARMTAKQADLLRNHPDVAGVWEDEVFVPQTSNTPAFLGLTGAGGQHTIGIKGEDVIVGILDSGITPENPSFADDGSYTDASTLGWNGGCEVGEETGAGENGEDTFQCNNKLIGAKFFNSTFASVYDIQYGLGEFESPRDADGHGTHTASTAAGNSGVTATREGVEIGTISGMAPRARVAAYKVCWNANYVNPQGTPERGCFFGDSMAAIDEAVADGVDVLNYSIGNSPNINTPVYNSALKAAEAGVFFAASAGNSGPGPSTTSNIAPWITTVAASTYDGTVALVGKALGISANGQESEPLFSLPGLITPPAPVGGLTASLVAVGPAQANGETSLACNSSPAIDNAAELQGNIALISRGACNFSEKILNAQNAGAAGVVVYSTSNSVIAMGGSGDGITIPGVMVSRDDGLALLDLLNEGSVSATLSDEGASVEVQEVGNLMAGFSSRGPNTTPQDIIKPDITAPGVQVLAGTSPQQLNFDGNEQGENFAYLSGTSMSGPHIAGIAALLIEQHPDWSPAQVKSAMMTAARQNVTKEDGSTPADPFDFGGGHVDPIPAMNPGLTYDANFNDYLGFLCGQNEDNLVASLSNETCSSLTAQGYATDPSQLNYPSIAISELVATETVTRTVTDVTGIGGTYTVSVEAPAGINVEVATFDANGNETESDDLVVEAGGKASYSLTFSKLAGFTPDEFVFGSITLTGTDGTEVRSPIAIKPAADVKIVVPEYLSLDLNRGRASFPVQMLYTGTTSLDYAGLTLPFLYSGSVVNDNGAAFDFATAVGRGQYAAYTLPANTKVFRVSLLDDLVDVEGADLDLYIWKCPTFSTCVPEAASENGGSNEDILLVNPEPAAAYVVFVHGYSTGNQPSANFSAPIWAAVGPDSSTKISGSSRAIDGRFNSIRVTTRGLNPQGLYMGAVTFYNDQGEAEGTTVLEVQP